jgi:hypothetical protein
MGDVEQARETLDQERAAVLSELAGAAAEAREAAERHKAWKSRVHELLERGRVAGVPIIEMARALGVSRQWTSHLLARQDRRRGLEKLLGEVKKPRKRRGSDA